MNKLKYQAVIEKDGEIKLTGLPYKKGQSIEMTILIESRDKLKSAAGKLLESKIIGIWKNRKDITDSIQFSRELRNHSQNRY